MPTTITSAGITFNDATSLTSANGVPSALKLTTARTINGVSFDGTANITVPATASGANVAKAWVNFNGTTSPGTIRSSYNVSSVTYNAAGNYTINFLTPMTDINYSVSGSSTISSPEAAFCIFYAFATSTSPYYVAPTQNSFRIMTSSGVDAANARNSQYINVQVFGN